MSLREYRYLIYSDLHRRTGRVSALLLFRQLVLGESYKYIFWMRTCRFARSHSLLKFTLYPIARLILGHYRYKFGFSIPFTTEIGPGFYIAHFGCVVVNSRAKIGRNCNLSHGVTIGQSNRGPRAGYPTIGDNVWIGPGAKVIGSVTIGNNVAIGANCVVTKDIPDNAVVGGVPGKVLSFDGVEGYIGKIDYDSKVQELPQS